MGNSETRGFDSSRPENLLRHLVALEDRVRKLEQALNVRPNGNVTLKAQGALRLEANAGMATVNAGHTRCSGVLQCDTMIANNVVGTSYTPGAGNLY